MKKLILAAVVICTILPQLVSAEPQAARTWEYASFVAALSPEWSLLVMPGHRSEFYRSFGDTKNTYLEEFFIGPNYTTKFDNFKLSVGLWYYYMYFPNRFTGNVVFSHNVELVPTLSYKIDPQFTLSDRVIFHNTLYSTFYGNAATQALAAGPSVDDLRSGFSCLMREMLTLSYALDASCTLSIGDEIFVGLIADTQAKPANGPGFSPTGITQNRLYIGGTYTITPGVLMVSPQYVFETNYDTKGNFTENDHYVFVTLTYILKLF